MTKVHIPTFEGFLNEKEVSQEEIDKFAEDIKKAQAALDKKIEELEGEIGGGWERGWGSGRIYKKYGEQDGNIIRSMTISTEFNLKDGSSWYEIRCGSRLILNSDNHMNDALVSQVNALPEKQFTKASQATSYADAFAAKWNKIGASMFKEKKDLETKEEEWWDKMRDAMMNKDESQYKKLSAERDEIRRKIWTVS